MKQQLKLNPAIGTSICQILGTRLTNMVKLSDNRFNQLINELEAHPFFEKLKNENIVRYKKFHRGGFYSQFLELNENLSTDHTSPDVELILETKQKAIQIIKKIGLSNFQKYFLYATDNISNNEMATKCGISVNEINIVVKLLNEISIHSEFYNPSKLDIKSQIKYNKLALVERTSNDDFTINFFSPNLARGKYEIDYEKLEILKNKKIKSFVRKLELVNIRKTVIYKILESVILHQKEFLFSSDLDKRRLLTQRELAEHINVNPSIICRSIMNKSIEFRSGKEIPLKNFFLNKKDIKISLIKTIINKNKANISAEKIKKIIKNDYRIDIPRRSISYYMNELSTKTNIN
ncbi:MAG: hypothetical protein PHE88_11360 [Elusimicrobia bacterium]|nr:hypothetical protein [Elusimicrobiota bacterium]